MTIVEPQGKETFTQRKLRQQREVGFHRIVSLFLLAFFCGPNILQDAQLTRLYLHRLKLEPESRRKPNAQPRKLPVANMRSPRASWTRRTRASR